MTNERKYDYNALSPLAQREIKRAATTNMRNIDKRVYNEVRPWVNWTGRSYKLEIAAKAAYLEATQPPVSETDTQPPARELDYALDTIHAAIDEGSTIEAVKQYRAVYGGSLPEAVEGVKRIQAERNTQPPARKLDYSTLTPMQQAAVRELGPHDNYKAHSNFGFSEDTAKALMDAGWLLRKEGKYRDNPSYMLSAKGWKAYAAAMTPAREKSRFHADNAPAVEALGKLFQPLDKALQGAGIVEMCEHGNYPDQCDTCESAAPEQATITPPVNIPAIFDAVDSGRIEAQHVEWEKVARELRAELAAARAALDNIVAHCERAIKQEVSQVLYIDLIQIKEKAYRAARTGGGEGSAS